MRFHRNPCWLCLQVKTISSCTPKKPTRPFPKINFRDTIHFHISRFFRCSTWAMKHQRLHLNAFILTHVLNSYMLSYSTLVKVGLEDSVAKPIRDNVLQAREWPPSGIFILWTSSWSLLQGLLCSPIALAIFSWAFMIFQDDLCLSGVLWK